ncbi:MAG: hypothetical protein WBG41_02970, partial [Acidimicrobiales bacterium]
MKSWARALKQWWLWLVGDSPLPGRRARLLLAGTAVVVLVLAGGAVFALQSPAQPTHSASSDNGATPGANLGKATATSTSTSTTSPAHPVVLGSTSTTQPRSVTTTTIKPSASGRTHTRTGTHPHNHGTTTTTTTLTKT